MNTQPTLFTIYKRFINKKVAAGETTYTAAELNRHVGCYEKITPWKRWNNNPYYTTRTYQTILRDLGCITKIKRGLWQINGPIPEWFGSFHFKGLKRGYDADNKYADHNCQYWKSLPDAHRVNPWKNIDPMRVIASMQPILLELIDTDNQRRRDELNATLDAVKEQNKQTTINTQNMTNNETTTKPEPMHFYTESSDQLNIDESKTVVDAGMVSVNIQFTVTAPFGAQFECMSYVNLFRKDDDTWGAECAETEMFLVSNRSAKWADIESMIKLMMGDEPAAKWGLSLDKYAEFKAIETQTNTPTINKEAVESTVNASNEKTYTKAQVEQILKAFAVHIVKDVESAIENECESLDEGDVVDVDFDSYDRRITIDLNTGSLSRTLSSAASDQIDASSDDFNIDDVELN